MAKEIVVVIGLAFLVIAAYEYIKIAFYGLFVSPVYITPGINFNAAGEAGIEQWILVFTIILGAYAVMFLIKNFGKLFEEEEI